MNNYKNFEVKDWLEDHRFQRWVFHREAGEFWRKFLEENPLQADNIEHAREILLSVRGQQDKLSEMEVKSRVAEIMDAIPADNPSNVPRWWNGNWLRLAAMLLLVSGIGFVVYENKDYRNKLQTIISENTEMKQATKLIEKINTSGSIQLVNLPDGSSVVLKKNSRITYPEHFDKFKREVSMSGEAFFEIVKNPAQPFLVYTGSMVTKVRGTSFSIKANDGDDEVKLVVKTGIVEVSARDSGDQDKTPETKKLILKPNEQVTFNQKSRQMVTQTLEKPVLLNIPVEKQDFEFKRTPLADVFTSLEKTYGVTIRFSKADISKCTPTARLGDEPIFEKLDMICAVVNAKYESRNGEIAITSGGCQ